MSCEHNYVSVFHLYNKITYTQQCKKYYDIQKPSVEKDHPTEPSVNQVFPPAPPDTLLCRKIIDGFCKATAPTNFEEAGCALCGSLTLQTGLSELDSVDIYLSILNATGQGFTQNFQQSQSWNLMEIL